MIIELWYQSFKANILLLAEFLEETEFREPV